MDYEKKYKEALSRAATELETCGADKSLRNMIYAIFPDELKESNDERIRKALVRFHKSTIDIDGIKSEEILAWLGKQGEQKPIDYNKELKKCRENPLYFFDKYVKLEKQKPACSEEDERVKKRILLSLEKDLMATKNSGCDIQDLEQCIAWLEKQGKHQQLYIRFGDIPSNEKSKIYRGEKEIGTENGVSVYPAFKSTNGDIVLGLNLPITKTTLHTQQHLLEYDNRPCYLVTGDYVGKDTDGQILISNVNIIEKIDNYRVKTEKQGDTTSDTRYEVKAGNSFSANGTLFDYEHATITQKDFACDAEEASYTAEVATGDGSIKTVVSKKVSLPNPQSKKWSEEDEVINNELIKYFESLLDCLATEERHNENRKWLKWLKSIKNKI